MRIYSEVLKNTLISFSVMVSYIFEKSVNVKPIASMIAIKVESSGTDLALKVSDTVAFLMSA